MRKIVALLLLTAASCGDTSGIVPEVFGGGSTPTTAASAPTTSQTTTLSSTTVASTTATTATVMVPTDTGVSASADCVLGWWDGSWHSTGDGEGPPPVEAGDALRVAMLDGVAVAQAVELFAFDDVGSPAWFLQTEPDLTAGIAASGEWDPVPYQVELSSASAEVYIDRVAEILSQRGYPGVPIELAQVIRTDLEGDGVDEVVVAARHPGAPAYDRDVGVFSIIFLRRVIQGEVQTAILHFSVFAAEDVGQATSAEHALVAAVADLNGDGTMEIAINGSGYEWYWSEAFEYVDDDLGPVSRMLCGGGV